MEFDSQLGVFSPDGRLIQVEYAQNASIQGPIAIIKKTNNLIEIAYDNRQSNSLHIPMSKLHIVDEDRNIYLLFSGLRPDSLLVKSKAISICRNYKYNTSEDISFVILAKKIAEYKQKFTIDQNQRPLGLRTVLFGFENGKPKIFIIETDGNFSEYESCALGYKNDIVMKYLESKKGDCHILKALLEVLQKDAKVVKAFKLCEKEGLSEIPNDEIKQAFENE